MKKYWPIAGLFLVISAIVLTNYTPGTWLTGWDNLHPEFDFVLNFRRALFSVWQEYQGLGLLAGMAHASDLFRVLFLWVMSLVIPQSFIRYFFHFSMLFLGALGTFYSAKKIFLTEHNERHRTKVALLSGLFYLLNVGTAQLFFTPFEPFSMFFGFFPWELYVLFRYLKEPTRKYLLHLALVNLIATAQAYVQTLFFVYLLVILLILFIYSITEKKFAAVKKSFFVLLIIFLMNAFWILPNAYFTFTSVSVTENAMNNRMNVDRFFESNKEKGSLHNTATLNWLDAIPKAPGEADFALPWKNHLASSPVHLISYLFFFVMLVGLTSKNKYREYLLALFFFCLILLLSDTPIFSTINNLFRSLPMAHQIFRSAINKIAVPTVFIFSLGFGLGIARISDRFRKTVPLIFGLSLFALLYMAIPTFQGNFFSRQVRISIPPSYFELFTYLKKNEKNQRIMNLPQDSYWGWGTYRWGSHGSGFLWYGIEQPIMDRAFDVWSKELEQYYWELSYALKKNDQTLFNNVVDKYGIGLVLFDSSYTPSDSGSQKNLIKQEDLLAKNKSVQLIKQFGSIKLYKIARKDDLANFVTISDDLPTSYLRDEFRNEDKMYTKSGQYRVDESTDNIDHYYPFDSLFTNRFQNEVGFTIHDDRDNTYITASIPKGNFTLHLPSLLNESLIPMQVQAKQDGDLSIIRLTIAYPEIFLGKGKITTPPVYEDFIIPRQNGNSEFILDILNREFVIINNLSSEFRTFGSFYVPKDFLSTEFMRIYSSSSSETVELNGNSFLGAKACDPQKNVNNMQAFMNNNSLMLKTYTDSACSTYSDPIKSLTPGSLHQISFATSSDSNERPKYCFYSSKEQRCLNRVDTSVFNKNPNEYNFTEFFEGSSFSDDETYITLMLEGSYNQETAKDITYANMKVTSYPFLGSYSLSESLLDNQSLDYTLHSVDNQEMTVVMPKLNSNMVVNNLLAQAILKNSALSNNTKKKEEYFIQERQDKDAKTLRLFSKNTTANLWFDLQGWDFATPYLLTAESANITGFPLTLEVISLKEKQKYLSTLITKNKQLKRSYYIIPPYFPFDEGVKIQFANSSFNEREISINEIGTVSLQPIPYNFVGGIFLDKIPLTVSTAKYYPSNTVKSNTYFYQTTFTKNGDEPKIIILSQAYSPGWKAFIGLPFVGKELKEHVLINNWANGWRLDFGRETLDHSKNSNNLASIILIFWPQYLEFVGFGLLGIVLIVLIFKRTN